MSDLMHLDEIEDAILRYVQKGGVAYEEIYATFSSDAYPRDDITASLKYLEIRNYIRKSKDRYLKAAFYILSDDIKDEEFEHHCEITPMGEAYLARSTVSHTSFENISNSNISHQSHHTKQSISADSLSPEMREKINDLYKAVERKDSTGIKQIFGYIADKSVDIAIALITNSTIK